MIIDLYQYLIKGDISSIIQLRDQDIIVVPPAKSVLLDSAITKPGIYEYKENETLLDLIRFAGGLSYNASGDVNIKRIKSLMKEVAV